MQTGQALTVTQIAAATGALTWIIIEALHLKKATSLGFVSGILAGLVAITPAAGDVHPAGAIALGILGAAGCYSAVLLKSKMAYDDTLDVFGIHGIAGIIGAIGLTFFLRAMPTDVSPDGVEVARTMGTQLWYQIGGVVFSAVYAGVFTLVLVVLIDKTIGLRLTDPGEKAGMDHALHGEHGYGLLNLN